MFGGRIGITELVIIVVIIALIVKSSRSRSFAAALLGFCLGAFVGFLLRPSVSLIGQLPFETVITRGSNLTGLNAILRPAAEQSFNYMLVGAIVGTVILGIWAGLARKPKPQGINTQVVAAAAAATNSSPAASVQTAFCTQCGKPLAIDVLFCGSCGTRKP